MKNTNKLQALRAALDGDVRPLQAMQRERLKQQMPYEQAVGILHVDRCPPELGGIPIVWERGDPGTLGEFIGNCREAGRPGEKFTDGMAIGWIGAADDRFDALELDFIELENREDRRARLSPGGTVGDLRQLFWQSVASLPSKDLEHPAFFLIIETSLDLYRFRHEQNR